MIQENQNLTKEEFIKELAKLNKQFSEVHSNYVNLVNEFIKQNPQIKFSDVEGYSEVNSLDDMALSRAWIEDRLNGKIAISGRPDYNKSRTHKIRKALGYIE